MIQANHPRFSCTSDMSLTIYGIIFSGPFMHTDTPSGTEVNAKLFRNVTLINIRGLAEITVPFRGYGRNSPNQVMI